MKDNEESSAKGSGREAAMEKDDVSEAKIVLPAKASANAAAQPKKPPHRKPTKRPPGMPRRALTAYNLFFQEERMLILEEKAKRVFRPAEDDDVDKPKRGGKLAGVIAGRWKHISPRRLARFKELAAVDAQRHSREMEEYQKRVAAEYLGPKQEKETSVVEVAIEDQQLPSSSSPSYQERGNDIPTAGPNMHLQDDRSTRSSSPVQQEQHRPQASSGQHNPSSPLHTNHLVGRASNPNTNLPSELRVMQSTPTQVPSIIQHDNIANGTRACPSRPFPNGAQILLRPTQFSSPFQQQQQLQQEQLASGTVTSWLQNLSSPLHTNHPGQPSGESTEQLVGQAGTNLSSEFRAVQSRQTYVLVPASSIFQHDIFASGSRPPPTRPSSTLQVHQGEPCSFQTVGIPRRSSIALSNSFEGARSVYEQEMPQPHQHEPLNRSLSRNYALLQQLLGEQQQGQHQSASTQNDALAALSFLGCHSSSMSRQERR